MCHNSNQYAIRLFDVKVINKLYFQQINESKNDNTLIKILIFYDVVLIILYKLMI